VKKSDDDDDEELSFAECVVAVEAVEAKRRQSSTRQEMEIDEETSENKN
jgi:hypothetical protein